MPVLADLQRGFAASLLASENVAIAAHIVEDGFTAAERLRIYRNSWRSVVIEALRLTYPAVDRLVGRDFFAGAAKTFVTAQPPCSGYLNEYGAAFAGFLETFPPSAALRYVPDVARFEWALNEAANAPDAPALDLAAVAATAAEQHAALRFEPHSSVRFLELGYPADRIADAVLAGDDEAMAAIDLSSAPVRLVVHRGPDGVEAQRVDAESYRFIRRLCAGAALGELLETSAADGVALLAEQLAKGRLSAFWTGGSARRPVEERPC